MSGILGTNFQGAHWRQAAERSEGVARAREARDRLNHRGVDFAGDWYDDRLFLGHAEQARVDSGVVGRLPLVTADAGIVVALDGHLSNARELRGELGKQHAFHGNGASEIIAQGYAQWGLEGMLERLRGGFAFALYDRKNARLMLARDAIGSRPLYYLHEEVASGDVGSLMFGSELKALESLANNDLLSIDHTAVYDYLTYRYVPAPKTLYQQVRKLCAGQCISIDLNSGHSALQTYWTPEPSEGRSYDSAGEFLEHGTQLLNAAVQGRTSGVTHIAGICQRTSMFANWLSQEHPRVTPLSLAVDDADDQASDLAATELRSVFDEPFADVGFAARRRLLQQLSGDVTCALSDLGAEVVFAGAERYRSGGTTSGGPVGWFRNKLGGSANAASTSVNDVFASYAKSLGGLLPADKATQKAAWGIPDDYNDFWYFQQYYRAELPRTLRYQMLDLQTLVPEHQLMQLDRQASREGVDPRTPLLDQDLVNWLLGAPEQFRAPAYDVERELFGSKDKNASVLSRLKSSLAGAAALLPGGGGAAKADQQTLVMLQQRFPELDAT